ncbi:DUF2878 domain-containing protein [Shewanella sp. 0m-4]
MLISTMDRLAQQHLVIINLLMFQAVWWLSILYQNSALWLTTGLLLVHFALSQRGRKDLTLMIKVASLGFAIDLGLKWAGVFQFQQFPFWLFVLWCHFALSLRYSLAFTQKLAWYVNAILGGVFGCLSYLAGERFEAVNLPLELFSSALILFAIWIVIFPMFVNVTKAPQ